VPEALQHLELFFTSQRRRRAVQGKSSASEEAGFQRLLRSLVRTFDLRGELHFGVLELDGRPLAWHISFEANQKLVFYQQTFAIGDWDLAPGEALLRHLLFFASDRAGGCGGKDIYVSRRQNNREDFGEDGWGPPQNLGCSINSDKDDFGPNYFEVNDVGILYFNSNRDGGAGGQDIYAATRGPDEAFGMPSFDLPTPVLELNTASNDQQPSVRRDGLEVIFTSDRPGGLGSFDLWVATRASTSDPWSNIQNLGSPVNSGAVDQRPALSWDGTELYFGSSRPGGLGSQDLYVSTRNKITGQQ